ncbi:uncharacterized protein LTR77_001566 [Saxophila tyrrhenica]|uniref:F-box domain-containing protein n=1 Tax=Saxophila tyrrhenica TaxID=1690608 RepID=A0AAV9PNL1_9PEZI|nr:hypothetical protein LTR77_001566 [Saxophila tyrrhenica]
MLCRGEHDYGSAPPKDHCPPGAMDTHPDQRKQTPFDIPELFTQILEELPPRELLKATGINRAARELVHTTSALHRALGQVPDPQSDFWVPLLGSLDDTRARRCGIDVKILPLVPYDFPTPDQMCGLKAKLQFGRTSERSVGLSGHLPKAAGQSRSILICQPPVFEVIVTLRCAPYRGLGLSKEQIARRTKGRQYKSRACVVQSKTGVTIGDLADAASTLERSHMAQMDYPMDCAHMNSDTTCPADVLPWFNVSFKLRLTKANALVRKYAEAMESSVMKGTDWLRNLLMYKLEMMEGLSRGEDPVTFEEWKADRIG